MHTTSETGQPELLAVREQLKLERLRYKLTMVRVQTKALETLERLMDDPEPTGNEKADRFEATKRNRQRLAANQTLIHCRTAQREKRLAKVGGMAMQRMAMPGAESPHSPEGIAMLRMAMPPQPSDNSGATAWPAGQAVRAATGAVAKSEAITEGAGHAVNGSACTSSHGLRPTDRRTQTMPPKKFTKPKHPRRSRKRRNKR